MMSYNIIKKRPPIYDYSSSVILRKPAIKVNEPSLEKPLSHQRYSVYDNNYDEVNNCFVDNDFDNVFEVDAQLNNNNNNNIYEISSITTSSSSTMMMPNHQSINDNLSDVIYSLPTKTAITLLEEDSNSDGCVNDFNNEIGNDDCKKEWEKVSQILASVEDILDYDESTNTWNNNNKKSASITTNTDMTTVVLKDVKMTIHKFLENINLEKYLLNFMSNGFDDTNFLNTVIDHDDLLKIDIRERFDIERILNETEKLPIMKKLDDIQYSTINEWLYDLKLNQYVENFYRKNICTITRLRQLYEIEFVTLLNIPKLGHRKRLLNSLGLLKPKLLRNSSRQSIRSIGDLYNTNDRDSATLADIVNNRSTTSTPTMRSKTVTFAEQILAEKDSKILANLIYENCDTSNSNNNSGNEEEIKINEVEDLSLTSKKQQLNCSKYLKDYKLSNQLWKHDTELLQTKGCNYSVQYLGSSPLNKLYSNKSPIKYNIDRLKGSAKQNARPLPSIVLNVSTGGIKFLHVENNEELCNYNIKHITSVCQDIEDLVYFAIITKTDPNLYHYCHVFTSATVEIANELILTIGQSFEVAYKLFCQSESLIN